MSNLLFTLNAILPIIIPILLGYFLKRINFFSEKFLPECNKLVFKVLIPILLFSNLYLADLSTINWLFVLFIVLAILLLFGIGLVVVILFIPNKKQKGVILQASFRSNYAIIGIPLASMLGGEAAKLEASVIAAVSVPLFNILAVIALSIFDKTEDSKVSIKSILYKIITNPLIIGVLAGICVCLINTGITKLGFDMNFFLNNKLTFITKTISDLSKVATPLALIVLGGRFEFSSVKSMWKELSIAVSLRLVIAPLILLTIAYFLGFNSTTQFAILIAVFASPIAVSSAPMAQQMGQDEELAGQIVVWTSALSAFTLFIIILICTMMNIL